MSFAAAKVLTQAAKLLEERGWGQGNDTVNTADAGGAMCANLALGHASIRVDPKDYAAYSYAQGALLRHLSIPVPHMSTKASVIIAWNDAEGRTVEEVVQALNDTAVKVMAEASA
uniref:Uncharacterized protein n=1 Tax=Caulobacter phage BL57 TaxID=3348355 RepID=A0AB74UIQ7_9VIRU